MLIVYQLDNPKAVRYFCGERAQELANKYAEELAVAKPTLVTYVCKPIRAIGDPILWN